MQGECVRIEPLINTDVAVLEYAKEYENEEWMKM